MTDLELYIQLRNGQPYQHPIFAENFVEAFPEVDTNNLPADRFAKFVRVAPPKVGTFEVCEGPEYAWHDGIVTDVYTVRPMTDDERAEKTAALEASAEIVRQNRIAVLNNRLATETDVTGRTLLSDCIAAHEAWVLQSVDPLTPPFPRFPYVDESGNWIAP